MAAREIERPVKEAGPPGLGTVVCRSASRRSLAWPSFRRLYSALQAVDCGRKDIRRKPLSGGVARAGCPTCHRGPPLPSQSDRVWRHNREMVLMRIAFGSFTEKRKLG